MVDSAADPVGDLTIADRVGEKTAVRAALGVPDVVRHQTAIGSILSGSTPGRALVGGDHPHASVDMSSPAPKVQMTIAVRWPCRLTDVCLEVRRVVTRDLEQLTGQRPARVDVSVAAVLTEAELAAKNSRRGYTDLPPTVPSPDSGQDTPARTRASLDEREEVQ
ncbi:Asp23/Gls24 family envelope stress response protein [Gordonia sp. LSe1-13]|uniref:Asp23/Gls24 family envelope stress response protein n=1 Tax=Gordonia sesuvii TaxID=3116777 RepID=A0ABU7MID7_9ACTN|nr:Asp23/Gls24 family envelope stress response protein [Gordonia sp. LSe1-13]